MSVKVTPAMKLKKLRERAGMSGRECGIQYAKLMGRRPSGKPETTWYRFEEEYKTNQRTGEKVRVDDPIPARVAKAAIRMFVGKGSPPITQSEITSISVASELLDLHEAAKGASTQSQPRSYSNPVQTVFPTRPNSSSLPVRFRAERGVYMTREQTFDRNYGPSPIAGSPQFGEGQYCTVAASEGYYPLNTILHCVDPSTMTSGEMVGRRVVLFVESTEHGGLGHIEIAEVRAIEGNRLMFHGFDGALIDGELQGVVRGSYMRE